jgi:hypothetical protein
MKLLETLLFCAVLASVGMGRARAERVDNVLAQMVPPDSVMLTGMRMEQLASTPLFQKLVAQQKIPQMDQFAKESGFDPRRDVRDLLLASNGRQTVLLARGTFHLKVPDKAKKINYHGFVILSNGSEQKTESGFCVLDSTLAAAGPLLALEAALDQYKSGNRNNAAALLTRARSIAETYQFWVVTAGNGNLISENMPGGSNGPDFGRIFRSLQNVLVEADLRNGLKGFAEGYCPSAQDAKSLSDAVRGMVGMARMNTPENQPDLLRVWDGFKVEQSDRKVTLTVDVAQDLMDELLKLAQSNGGRKGRSPGTDGTGPGKNKN